MQRQLEDKRSRLGIPLTAEDAALKIQAVARGYIARQELKKEINAELEFLKMRPVATDPKKDPNTKVLQVCMQSSPGPRQPALGE
eukprot:scaffold101566_cov37-Prasinocladus_malaysianus.AAC.1